MEKTILSFGLAAVIAVGLISMTPTVPSTTPLRLYGTIKDTSPVKYPLLVRDTLPGKLRRDKIQKRKAELDALEASSYLNDAMKLDKEQQMLRTKALMDTLSRLYKDTLRMGADAAKLADERAKLIWDRFQMDNDESSGSSDRRIQQITKNLAEAGLIPDHNSFSFSLNNERLLVNGKTAPDAVFQKLKERYLHSPKDHFNYMQHGGSMQTDVSIDDE
jgi:hypothetical protein